MYSISCFTMQFLSSAWGNTVEPWYSGPWNSGNPRYSGQRNTTDFRFTR